MAGTAPVNFTTRGVHISVPLSQFSLGYHPTGMIAEQVMPVMPVKNENDLYYIWDKGQAFRIERSDGKGTLRADKARSKNVNFGATTASYTAEAWAANAEISDRERANADSVLQLEYSRTRRVQDLLLLDQEVRVAAILQTLANYAAANYVTLSGTSQWNNISFASQTNGQHSVIQQEILAGQDAVRKSTGGLIPNTIVIPYSVANILQNDVGLVDLIKYTRGDLLVEGLLPPTLWGMKVLIPRAISQSNVEGEAYAGADVWGKSVWMGYVNPNPGIDSLTFGTIFRSRPWQVKTWREEEREVTVYEPSMVQAEKLVSADCGYLIQNCIA